MENPAADYKMNRDKSRYIFTVKLEFFMVYFLRVWYNGIKGIWLVNIRTAIVQIFYIKYTGRGKQK